MYSGLDTMIFRGKVPWTFSHGEPDYARTKKASECEKIEYPKPDGVTSFELLDNVARTGTYHAENQPVHLRLKNKDIPTSRNLPEFDGPEQRFCPGRVETWSQVIN
jgi:electron-transferring-flavoprotein dehydrogenase